VTEVSSHFKAAVQRQPQVRTMLEWRRLSANRKVRRMAVSIPNAAPVVHFTSSRSRYQFILLGEQGHMCVNNLLRVAPSGETAGNRTRNLSITNPTPYRYTTKPHMLVQKVNYMTILSCELICIKYHLCKTAFYLHQELLRSVVFVG